METLTVLDLFSGIGGFSLGLESTGGFQTAAFCEIDAKARRVLRRHWPSVPIFEDVTSLKGTDVGPVDVICGGFPCQDISLAGKGAGLAGSRSGLWSEFLRLIDEIGPRWALIENVSALRSRGLDAVLGGLAALGYDAEWHCIPAAAVGAPHRRDRIWIVAYPNTDRGRQPQLGERHGRSEAWVQRPLWNGAGGLHADVANTHVPRLSFPRLAGEEGSADGGPGPTTFGSGWWATEPDVGRVAHGVPGRMDRLKQLGNAVVPHIPALIGRAILAARP